MAGRQEYKHRCPACGKVTNAESVMEQHYRDNPDHRSQREDREAAFKKDAQAELDKVTPCGATDSDGRKCDRYSGHTGPHHMSGKGKGQGQYLDRDTTMSHDMNTSHALFHRWQHRGERNRVIPKNYELGD